MGMFGISLEMVHTYMRCYCSSFPPQSCCKGMAKLRSYLLKYNGSVEISKFDQCLISRPAYLDR